MATRVVLATHNEHKVHELRQIVAVAAADLDLEVVSMAEYPDLGEVPETEVTFVGNATLKATAIAEATGVPALADDSGLAVEVLGGSPGVFSARWSGQHGGAELTRAARDASNLRLLLDQIADVAAPHRRAAFHCAAVLAVPGGGVIATDGILPGVIVTEPVGSNGFGYDPIFVPDDESGAPGRRTLAEYADEEKNAISHRGRAFRALVPLLAERLSLR